VGETKFDVPAVRAEGIAGDYRRACIAAGIDTETGAAPRNAYAATGTKRGAAEESELFNRTRAESGTWQKLEPDGRTPFDDEVDQYLDPSIVAPHSAFDGDRDMIELRETLARWSGGKPKRLRTSNRGLSVGFDVAHSVGMDAAAIERVRANDAPVSTEIIGDYFELDASIHEAIDQLDDDFGDHKSAEEFLVGLKFYLCSLPARLRVREIPNKATVAALLSRMERAS
jgi:hypothetical protein